MARIRSALVAIAVLAGIASGGALAQSVTASGAGAAAPHRAMVVVETGSATYRQVITFASDSITGLQALDLAGAQPVVYSFAGQGGAVCRLYGVGRDAGPSCLGGADGDNRYWAYFRAPAGTGTFTYSRAGAGSTQVHDGDVEGWRFGTGAEPGYVALPPVTPPSTVAPVVAPPPRAGGTGGSVSAPVVGPSGAATTGPMQIDPAALAAFLAGTTTTTTAPAADDGATSRAATEVEGKRAARSVHGSVMDDPGDGGNGAGSLVIFAVVAVALVGGGLLLRRSRRRPVP
jgi:hypothetical protein